MPSKYSCSLLYGLCKGKQGRGWVGSGVDRHHEQLPASPPRDQFLSDLIPSFLLFYGSLAAVGKNSTHIFRRGDIYLNRQPLRETCSSRHDDAWGRYGLPHPNPIKTGNARRQQRRRVARHLPLRDPLWSKEAKKGVHIFVYIRYIDGPHV